MRQRIASAPAVSNFDACFTAVGACEDNFYCALSSGTDTFLNPCIRVAARKAPMAPQSAVPPSCAVNLASKARVAAPIPCSDPVIFVEEGDWKSLNPAAPTPSSPLYRIEMASPVYRLTSEPRVPDDELGFSVQIAVPRVGDLSLTLPPPARAK